MKKVIAMLLLTMLLLSVGCKAAAKYPADGIRTNLKKQVSIENGDIVRASTPYDATANELTDMPSSDDRVVLLDNGGMQLDTNGIRFTVHFPFGWSVYTQDVEGQLEDYLYVEDAQAIVQMMQDEDICMVGYTPTSEAFFYVYLSFDNLEKLVGTLNEKNSGVKDTIVKALQSQLGNDAEVRWKTCGDNSVLVVTVNYGDGSGKILYEVIDNGVGINLNLEVDGEIGAQNIADMDAIAESLVVG